MTTLSDLIAQTRQLTPEEAVALGEGKTWKDWTDREIATFQITQECLCIPFGRFQEAVSKTVGRPVFTHEFSSSNVERLFEEIHGLGKAPSMEEIIAMLPAGRTIILGTD